MSRRAARLVLLALAIAPASCGLVSGDTALTPFPLDGVNDFGAASPIEVCVGSARVVAPAAAVGLGGSLCVADGVKATTCDADSDCDGIERCVCGTCLVEACVGSSCGDGRVCRGQRCTDACAHDADCAAGERCATGGCARPCSRDDECHFGERCDDLDGVCSTSLCNAAIPCAPGQSCRAEQTVSDLREPEVVTLQGARVGFVQIVGPGSPPTSAILRARIDSDARWTAEPEAPVVSSKPGESVGAPAVLADGAHVEMYFAKGDGSAILHAVSEDGGKTFTRDATPALVPAQAWEQGWVGSPAVVAFSGTMLLAYEGGPRAGIGLALLGDAGKAERISKAPVVSPSAVADPVFWRDVTEVRAPYLVAADTMLRIYFTGRGIEAGDAIVEGKRVPAPPNDSIGLVATRDLQHFDAYPAGPVFSRVVNLRDFLGESEAAIQIRPGGQAGASIVFVSADASGRNPTGLARAGTP
jgi:hypothetical protein